MFNIRHIDHLVIRVRNLQPMLDFYLNVIGCAVEKTQEDLGLYQLRAGDSLIDFIPVEGPLGRVGGAGSVNSERSRTKGRTTVGLVESKRRRANGRVEAS